MTASGCIKIGNTFFKIKSIVYVSICICMYVCVLSGFFYTGDSGEGIENYLYSSLQHFHRLTNDQILVSVLQLRLVLDFQLSVLAFE